MIDLRSDTLTMPDSEMLNSILSAKLGDDGRAGANGRGEDETVNELEDLGAKLTKKEAALLFPTGTMGNTIAILSMCKRGEPVLIEEMQHILLSEKYLFDELYGGLIPIKYKLNTDMSPDIEQIDKLLKETKSKVISIESSHNFSGGYCIPIEEMKKLRLIADKYGAKIHLDGARIFHAAAGLKVDVGDITQYVDSIMFCLSKGLGAPVGSLVCGTHELIQSARNLRKSFGGGMRQGGIVAAPGIYALNNNVERLYKDIENTKYVFNELKGKLNKISMQNEVQTNILMLNLHNTHVSPQEFCNMAEKMGLLIRPVLNNSVRLVFYKGIDATAAANTVKVILELDKRI